MSLGGLLSPDFPGFLVTRDRMGSLKALAFEALESGVFILPGCSGFSGLYGPVWAALEVEFLTGKAWRRRGEGFGLF